MVSLRLLLTTLLITLAIASKVLVVLDNRNLENTHSQFLSILKKFHTV